MKSIIKKVSALLAVLSALCGSLSAYAMDASEFDDGMRKGISYYNHGLYYEAKDEFQWFCDFNWGRMNDYQQSVALNYLDNTKQQIVNLVSGNPYDVFNGKFIGGGVPIPGGSYIGRWNVSLSNTTSSSLVFGISQSESDYYADNVFLTRQANGSYTGSAYTERGMSYYTVWIETENRIAVTVEGGAETTGTKILYRN